MQAADGAGRRSPSCVAAGLLSCCPQAFHQRCWGRAAETRSSAEACLIDCVELCCPCMARSSQSQVAMLAAERVHH
eukprot:15430812-Alexandrium_andersonii.AAC.1